MDKPRTICKQKHSNFNSECSNIKVGVILLYLFCSRLVHKKQWEHNSCCPFCNIPLWQLLWRYCVFISTELYASLGGKELPQSVSDQGRSLLTMPRGTRWVQSEEYAPTSAEVSQNAMFMDSYSIPVASMYKNVLEFALFKIWPLMLHVPSTVIPSTSNALEHAI